jgi:hypothetical protein
MGFRIHIGRAEGPSQRLSDLNTPPAGDCPHTHVVAAGLPQSSIRWAARGPPQHFEEHCPHARFRYPEGVQSDTR